MCSSGTAFKSDDLHLGRAIALLRDVARIYSGEIDQPAGPSGAPRDPGPGAA